MRKCLPLLALSVLVPALLAGAALTPRPAQAEKAAFGTYRIDGVHSSAVFRIRHNGIAPFYGRFNDLSGEFVLAEDFEDSEVRVEVAVDSVDTANSRRDGHLKSPDFFNAVQYPTIVFVSKEITKKDAETFTLTGELELHGKKQDVTAEVRFLGTGGSADEGLRAGFGCELTIDRTDFDVGTGFGEDALSHDVTVLLGIQGVKS